MASSPTEVAISERVAERGSIADAAEDVAIRRGKAHHVIGAPPHEKSLPLTLCEAAVIRGRGQPGRLAKRRGKRAGLAEADRQSDIGHRGCGLCQ
jgi:hypothetical protein